MPKGREARAARALRKREPEFVETDRNLLGLRGPSSSAISLHVLRDLLSLKKPAARMLSRKNDIRPFEDASSLEFLCEKNDCSAFTYCSSSKKRPDNIVLGRTFDHHVLDMVELGVTDFAPIELFKGPKARVGSCPAFIFQGDAWGRDASLTRLQSLVIDVWGGRDRSKLSLAGLDHVIVLTAVDPSEGTVGTDAAAQTAGPLSSTSQSYKGSIHWRTYSLVFSRVGGDTPKVDLVAMGPSIDMKMRRVQLASDDLFRTACKQPAG